MTARSNGGEADFVDPGSVQTLSELARGFQQLRGTRSYAALDQAINPKRSPDGPRLPASTLTNLLNGKSVPTRETVCTFLSACGLTDDAIEPWLAAWERVATSHLRSPAGAVRVRDARPRLLGVHASIQVLGSEDDLPPYVPRDLDGDLRRALAAAALQGGFVLLVGGSSVGKSRTLVEAVRSVMPEWWLIHPDAAEPDALRAIADESTPRTVVWLDELQRYLDQPSGLGVGTMRSMINAGVVVVATLWPHEYGTRTAPRTPGKPDPYANDRELLGRAHVTPVPEGFSPAERQRAQQLIGDQRIRIALETKDAGFTQVLAAGPALINWWQNAREHNCYGRAVIDAALDARRVGAQAPLTRDFLSAAAPAYLTPRQQATAPEDWLNRGLAFATTPLHGAAATLSPIATGMGHTAGYVVADYLHQHARQVRRTTPLPEGAWAALVGHHDPADTFRLGENAYRRMTPHAEALLRQAVDGGEAGARYWLADLLAQLGRNDAATSMLEALADEGDAVAEDQLAEMLADQSRADDLRARANAGHRFAAAWLADLLAEEGRVDELTVRADAGDRIAEGRLVDLLIGQGQIEEAVVRLTAQAGDGNMVARRLLAELLADIGRTEEATIQMRISADDGDFVAANRLSRVLDEEGWLATMRTKADDGDFLAAAWLAETLAERGMVDELRARAEAGDHDAAFRLVDLLVDLGLIEEAIGVLQTRVAADGRSGAEELADLLVEKDRVGEAIDLLRVQADAGRTEAGFKLADLLAGQGRLADLEAEVHAGTPGAAKRLRRLTSESGIHHALGTQEGVTSRYPGSKGQLERRGPHVGRPDGA